MSYEYTWLVQGEPFATTVLKLETVTDPNARSKDSQDDDGERSSTPRKIRVSGDLTYDRDGRVLTARSTLDLLEGAIHTPIRYERRSEEHGRQGNVIEEHVIAKFREGKVSTTSDGGNGELQVTQEELPPPVWILDRDSPEQWALLSPYLDRIAESGSVSLYAPTTRSSTHYRVRFDREEKDGDVVRRRWSIIGPALNAKLWTDREGRFLEYTQEKIQIVRTAVREK